MTLRTKTEAEILREEWLSACKEAGVHRLWMGYWLDIVPLAAGKKYQLSIFDHTMHEEPARLDVVYETTEREGLMDNVIAVMALRVKK